MQRTPESTNLHEQVTQCITTVRSLKATVDRAMSSVRLAVVGSSRGALFLEGPKQLLDEAASRGSMLTSEYIHEVIEFLHKNKAKFDEERTKEVEEQKEALLRLALVLESRLRSESSMAKRELVFDASLDDDEMLLRLMREVDTDRSGSISEEELLASSALNPAMRAAFEAAFRCNIEAMEEALAHLNHKDFGVYCKWGGAGSDNDRKSWDTFDRKASVRAVFEATLRATDEAEALGQAVGGSAQNDGSQRRFKLSAAATADKLANHRIAKAGLKQLANDLKNEHTDNSKLCVALGDLAKTLLGDGVELDYLGVKRAALRVPRVSGDSGQRMVWIRAIGLDAALARHLNPGTLEDGLEGLKGMSIEEAQTALESFFEDTRRKFLKALQDARQATGSRSAAEANSKFDGFEGSFATLEEFHAGAGESLKLGYPNPDTMKGIMLEHTHHPSVTRLFVTPNYRIATSLLLEYAWAMLQPGAPEDPETQELQLHARDNLLRLAHAREVRSAAPAASTSGAASELCGAPGPEAHDDQLLFPGEVGDSYLESLVVVTFPGVTAGSAQAKACEDATKTTAINFLTTDEERARGVQTQDHQSCMERIRRGISVLLPEQGAQAVAEDGLLRVGVLLPVPLARAEAICKALAKSHEGGIAEVIGCKRWAYCWYTGVGELRNWLKERSLVQLKEIADKWAELKHAAKSSHEALCKGAAAAFDEAFDDDEIPLRLMHEIDANASRASSEEEEFAWTGLEPAIRAAAGPDSPEAMEVALAHLDAVDFGSFCRGYADRMPESVGDSSLFDAKASARAVFHAVSGFRCAGRVPEPAPLDGAADDAERAGADDLVQGDAKITRAGLEQLADSLGSGKEQSKLATALRVLARTLQDEGAERGGSIARGPAEESSREALCKEMLASFVRADFRAALRNATDAQIAALLVGWKLDPKCTSRQSMMEQAVKELDSEDRWKEVEGWVRLYRGRIQGRTLLGIKGLMVREKEKIMQYGLKASEVLATYLYTGPEFVLFNGICRSFPPSMLDLLKGDGTTPDNRLCTTLFCLSSALRKLSRFTPLPPGLKVYRGLGQQDMPKQFLVPHGSPPWLGGVERSFMSTTADKSIVAIGYCTVVEIGVGRVQIGGDVSFLSMVHPTLSQPRP